MAISKCTLTGVDSQNSFCALTISHFFLSKKELFTKFCPKITRTSAMLSKSNCYYGNFPLLYSPTVLDEPPIAPPLFLLFSIHFSYFKIMGRVPPKKTKKNTLVLPKGKWERNIDFLFLMYYTCKNKTWFVWINENFNLKNENMTNLFVSSVSTAWGDPPWCVWTELRARLMRRSIIRGEDDRTDTTRTGLDSVL